MNQMPNNEPQDIEQLRQRYEKLNTEKAKTEANLDNARKRLEELKSQARETYGTDDLDTLQQKLEDMKNENRRKRQDYQESLDAIEKDLDAVDQEYQQAQDEQS